MARLPSTTSSSDNSFTPKSSFIELASYDAAANVMTLTFKTGSQYKYLNVGLSTWLSFKQSPDHSSYYSRAIKGNLSSIPVTRKVIGKKTDSPLHKIKQERTLTTHGHTERKGFKSQLNPRRTWARHHPRHHRPLKIASPSNRSCPKHAIPSWS